MKELNLENYDLSDKAITLLKDAKIEEALNDREQIEKIFIESGKPIFEKVIDFQVRFGGVFYRMGESFYDGFKMGVIGLDDKENYIIRHCETRDIKDNDGVVETRYYYECMDYDYAGDWGPHIDQDGKIFDFSMGVLFPVAETIEEYLEDEAIRHDLLKKSWVNHSISEEKCKELIEKKVINRVENKHFSHRYFNWWKNDEETIFIRIDTDEKTLGGYLTTYRDIYCSNQDLLDSLYENEILELQEKGLSDKEIATKLKLREAFVTRILDEKFSIEVKYINKKRDWIRAARFIEPFKLKVFRILKAALLLYLVLLWTFCRNDKFMNEMIFVIFIFYIVVIIIISFIPIIKWNEQFSAYPSLLLERKLTLARKRILIESIDKKYVANIGNVSSVIENKDYIILILNNISILSVIPKEAFSNNEEKKEFLEILSKFNDVNIKLYKERLSRF